jgi:hypothetical protein
MDKCLRAGASKIVITPPVGFKLSGYEDRIQGSVGVHDELYARALVMDDGAEKVAIVSCDVVGLPKEIVKEVRREVETSLGIKGDSVMVAATHTHAGPDFDFSNGDYLDILIKEISGAIRAASLNLVDARIGAGKGSTVIGYNRRNPQHNFFLVPYPEGVTDSEVAALRVNNEKGDSIAAIINTPCHAVVLGSTNLLISADYPGYAMRMLESTIGGVPMFLNGCCGNINPVHTDGGHTVINGKIVRGPDLFREAERLGKILGGEALKVLEQIEETTCENFLKAKRSQLSLPVRKDIPKEMLDMLKQIDVAHSRFALYQSVLEGRDIITEVQAISMGDIVIVCVPGEIFVEFGLEIKKKSPFKYTLVSELANDVIGYVPVPEAFTEGGYEPTATIVSQDAGAKITQAALDLLKDFKEGE